jgi:hypothetical protein
MHSTAGIVLSILLTCEAICIRPIEGQTLSFLRQFTTPGIDRATAVAADASGIYVVGNRAFGVDQGGGVRKYDSRGNELWTTGFSRSGPGSAQLVGAAADGTGVYVIGYLRAPTGGDTGQFVRKYSSGGSELWTRQLEFQVSGGVAADPTGVYVAGPGFLRKYNLDGEESWTSRIAGTALGVAVDGTAV